MRRSIGFVFIAATGAAGIFACTGDDTTAATTPGSDAGHDATAFDANLPLDAAPPEEAAASDASDAAPGDAGGPFLLLTYAFDGYKKSEYAAVDLGSGQVRGRFEYAKYGTNQSTARAPWVMNQYADLVMRMDPSAPWSATSSWTVSEPKRDAGGNDVSDPWSVAESDTKAYVALYNRDVVPVLDTTTAADAGAPAKAVDLTGLVQPGDSDGYVEATAAFYDATRKYVWLVLGDIDLNNVDPQGYFLICTPGLKSTVVAIDTTTDTLVNGKSYALKGVEPEAIAYDAKNDRLVILSAGCNEAVDGGDAGKGPMVGRVIESLDLASGQSTLLLDANAQQFPGQLAVADAHHAFVSFGGTTYAWDPTTTTLGATVSAPDSFVIDAKGRLVGPRTSYLGDGGVGSIDVIAVDPSDGGTTTIGPTPVTQPDPGGYFEGLDLWPRP